jgi:hypothetical protein
MDTAGVPAEDGHQAALGKCLMEYMIEGLQWLAILTLFYLMVVGDHG